MNARPLRSTLFLRALCTLVLGLALQGAAAQAPAPARGLPTLAPIVREVTPAVVNISVMTRSPLEDNPLFRDPFFRRFFNLPEQPQEQAAGSGVIVDAARGYVLTNHHVIRDAEQVIVTLKDRRQFRARLVGTDPGTDIAVLQIEARDLTALKFGDSDQLNVGDYVIAIGNPFGIGQTVTSGIVSALGRTGLSVEGYEDFIQTDASINPGNSGGALVNLRGELVGINSAIIGPAGGNVGIGFAVPSNMASAVMTQIVRYGEVRRGRLGIEMADVTPALARKLGVSVFEGAVVGGVEPNSPAEKAGLHERDVIVGMNGRPIRSAAELRARLGLTPIGEDVELRIRRAGEARTVRARIEAPQKLTESAGQVVSQLPGMRVVEIERGSPLYQRIQGLVVASVERDSAAWQAGIRPGDIIYGANRRRVRSPAELQKALRSNERRQTLNILRGESELTITLR
ncbi:MAG TPA: Do family serine endopeptidase [Burkholderiales bacterium]|nr:Do family serine endopeptidase [Burkholderiales bacterium]